MYNYSRTPAPSPEQACGHAVSCIIRTLPRESCEGIQAGREPPQAFRDQFSRAADADAEAVGRLEPAAGHDRAVEPVAEQGVQRLRIAGQQAREGGDAVAHRRA